MTTSTIRFVAYPNERAGNTRGTRRYAKTTMAAARQSARSYLKMRKPGAPETPWWEHVEIWDGPKLMYVGYPEEVRS